MSAAEARELLEVRLSLEPSATELAAHRRTEADIAAMRTAAEKLLPVNRVWGEDAITAHRQFHRAVYVAFHNATMIKLRMALGTNPNGSGGVAWNFLLVTSPEPSI